MRRLLVVANWKLNGNKKIINNFINTFLSLCSDDFLKELKYNVAIAPPMLYLDLVDSLLKHSFVHLCSQNVDIFLSGAFTGDISAVMLKDLNVKYVIIGHSERRIFHRESNEYIAKKFFILKKQKLVPILCVGENKQERENNRTEIICIKQINAIIDFLGIQAFRNSVIAYEPVWAIGSGISADPEKVQKIHRFIRNYLAQYDESIAEEIVIQYGGSVNSMNVKSFVDQEDVDGVLVGSSSLDPKNFLNIIKQI